MIITPVTRTVVRSQAIVSNALGRMLTFTNWLSFSGGSRERTFPPSRPLGLVNAFIRPVVSGFACGLIVLTLGLFTLVINGLMLWLASYISERWLASGFHVDGLWSAVLGAIIISVFSFLVSTFVGTRKRKR